MTIPVDLKQDILKKKWGGGKGCVKISRILCIQCVGKKECHSLVCTGELTYIC